MKLSIWILKDWFDDGIKDTLITSGRLLIEGIRLHSPKTKCSSNILYVGSSDSFFRDGRKNIVCKCQNDYFVLESEDLVDIFNRIQDAWAFYADWFQKCTECVHKGENLSALLNLSTELFPTPVIVVDAAQTLVAISPVKAEFQNSSEWLEATERGSVSEASLREFNLAHPDVYKYKHVFPVDEKYFFTKGYCKHLFINGARTASIILKDPDDLYSKGRLQLFDLYTDIISDWISLCGENSSAFHVSSYFANALEGDEYSISAMIRQTLLFGWDEKCSKVLFLLTSTTDTNLFDIHTVTNLTHEAQGTYAIIHKNKIVILANNDLLNASEFSSYIISFLKKKLCCGAVSFAFSQMGQLSQAYHLTLSALESNRLAPGVLYHCHETSLIRMSKILTEQASSTLQHPAIGILKDYDEKNKSFYYDTLFCFLKNERRQQPTSDELFIHRNTLFQRLQKIREILPIDLENPEERFHLLLSFYQDYFSR